MPAVITEFIRSYTRAMRSNIARTCVSGNVPARPEAAGSAGRAGGGISKRLLLALQRGDVLDELVELLGIVLLQLRVGRHRRGRVHQRPRDRVRPQPVPHLRQVGPERVAVLADLVASEAARGRGDLLPLLELRAGGELDLGRRAGESAEHAEVGHRDDRGDAGGGGGGAPPRVWPRGAGGET